MATDPVRQIRRRRFGQTFDRALGGAIAEIAALPPRTRSPYVSATLDWRPAGENPGRNVDEPLKASQRGRVDPATTTSPNRPARIELEAKGDELLAGFERGTDAFKSVGADLERIANALESDLPESANGAVIVANHDADIFIVVPLGLPVETTLSVGPTPALRALVQVAEDNEPYAILAVEQQESTLTFFVQNTPVNELDVVASDWPRKQQAGGWSQRRFQARADERIEATAAVVADEVRTALTESGVDTLIVGGAEVMMSALESAWHDEVRERVLDTIRVAPDATNHDLADQVAPVLEAAERESEESAVSDVEDAIGEGALGWSGAEAVAIALARSQVELLVMNDDFAASGWVDPDFALAGTGEPPADHPAGGDPESMVGVEFGDEFVRMALNQAARIEIVHTRPASAPSIDQREAEARSAAAERLDALGGVGAVLRFSDHPTE